MVICRGAIPFITVSKSKMYCNGKKSIATELTFYQKQYCNKWYTFYIKIYKG